MKSFVLFVALGMAVLFCFQLVGGSFGEHSLTELGGLDITVARFTAVVLGVFGVNKLS